MILTFARNSGANHHCCRKGQKVLIKLYDGTTIVDKFKDKNRKYCILENHEYSWADVKFFAVYKQRNC